MKTTHILFSAALLATIVLVPETARSQDAFTISLNTTYLDTGSYTYKGKALLLKRNDNHFADINMNAISTKAAVNALTDDYFSGSNAADSNYTAKRSGKRAVLITTLIGTPVLGVIPALICSVSPVKDKELHIADISLKHSTAYLKGYKHEAQCIKKRAIWGNYLIGSTVWVGVVQLLIF